MNMMRVKARRAALAATCLCAASAAAAQPAPESPLIIDRARADRAPALPPIEADAVRKSPALPGAVAAEGVAVPIQTVRFEGVEAPAPVAAAARRFIGEPASTATLKRLADALSAAYAHADVALYTVSIPAQDLADGVVRVQLTEGRIENIVIAGDTERHSIALVKHYAAELAKAGPLSRTRLERYLSLMRDIPGLEVTAELRQGRSPGGVVLVLTLKFKRDRITGGFDNRGSRLLGDSEAQVSAKLYRLFREGDETSIVAAAGAELKRYRYAGLTHSTPIGHEGMRLTFSGGYLTTRPRHSLISGEAETLGLTLSYPIIRGYRRNLSASVGIDGLNSDNAALGTLLATERTRAARIAIAYSDATAERVLGASASISRGLDILGARVTQPLADTRFTKLTARVSLDRQIARRWIARGRIVGQYSRDALPAAERLAIGGADFGRAFDTALVSGDRGYAGVAELAWRPPLGALLDRSELYGFADGARVRVARRGPFAAQTYDLASAGGGVRLTVARKATVELEVARPIESPYPGYRSRWRTFLSWKIGLD